LNEGVEQRRIIGGRQHQMRAAGVGDQRVAGTGAALDQGMHFVFGGFQSTR
jgi:hypothetical protein